MKKATTTNSNFRLTVKLMLAFLFCTVSGIAQYTAYQFTGTGTCPNQNLAVTTPMPNATFSSLSCQNINCVVATDVYSNDSWNTSAVIDLNEYVEFSISTPSCYFLNLDNVSFRQQCSTNGTANWHLRSSIDNYTNDLGSGPISTTQVWEVVALLPAVSFTHISGATFRIYLTGINSASDIWTLDDVASLGGSYQQNPFTYYQDADNDGFGNPFATIAACIQPAGYVLNSLDCDDANPAIHPGAVEMCDGIDNDCNGGVDDNAADGILWHWDYDGDNWGDPQTTIFSCTQPAGYIMNGTDCNDNNALVHPGAPEICNGIDDNCDGNVDNNAVDATAWYDDADHDYYGDPNFYVIACNPPFGYVGNGLDCNDFNPNVYPGAPEIPDNGIDEDCNGSDSITAIQTYIDASAEINIFPNPGNEKIIISIGKNWETQIEISVYSLDGRLLSTQKISNDHSEIILDTKDLPAGVYIINMNDKSRKAQMRWSKL